jgi:hypothetical protein
MNTVTNQIPPGWYPDPSGERQWRVWNGSQWSDLTRPYGEHIMPPATSSLTTTDLVALSALRRLTQFGVVAYYTGFAMLVSVIAHWPGSAHPEPARFASAALGVAVGLTVIGTLSFAVVVHALQGHWSFGGVVPLVNTFVASHLMSLRIGITNGPFRLGADVLITVGFIVLSPAQPWVGIALAGVAFSQLARGYLLCDRISDPSLGPSLAS